MCNDRDCQKLNAKIKKPKYSGGQKIGPPKTKGIIVTKGYTGKPFKGNLKFDKPR